MLQVAHYLVKKGPAFFKHCHHSPTITASYPHGIQFLRAYGSITRPPHRSQLALSFQRTFKTKQGKYYTGFNSFKSTSHEIQNLTVAEAYAVGAMQGLKNSRQRKPWRWIVGVGVFLCFMAAISPETVGRYKDGVEQAFSMMGLSEMLKGENWEIASKVNVTFNDVKGCEEAVAELQHIVDFLRNPGKFSHIGAKLPKGILLVGPPGVGKTLMAKAVAGEAKVTFIHVVGSQFDDVYVGSGANRIRQLFETAKRHTPCVIFIDEFDAVGGRRVSTTLYPYANQTINQLLAEMDGFESTKGVIVLAATNKKANLDPAVLRPGRFDLEIFFWKPDMAGRKSLLEHYLKKVPFNFKHNSQGLLKLAVGTTGMTGADISNLVNQAAIQVGQQKRYEVTMDDLWSARDRLLMGVARKRLNDAKENEVTAAHEAGHALVSLYTPGSTPLHKVTIIPRSGSLGHTSSIPEKDEYYLTKSQLLAALDVAMGGRVAEELTFGKEQVGTGAGQDFEIATNMAEAIVTKYGMSSRVGHRILNEKNSSSLSSTTLKAIDEEITLLLRDSYERARSILISHSDKHRILTEALLKYETLDAEDVRNVLQGGKPKIAALLDSLEKSS